MKTFKKASLTLKSFFRSSLSIFALFFLVFASIFTNYVLNISSQYLGSQKITSHFFTKSLCAIFTLVSDEFEFCFGLMKLCRLWNCDGFGLLCHVDREKYTNMNGSMRTTTSHAHFTMAVGGGTSLLGTKE